MRFTVSLTGLDGVRARLAAIQAAVPLALARTAGQIEDQITRAAASHKKFSRTGALVRSVFKARIPGGWQIGHDLQEAPHARWVVNGARPHLILPRKKKLLRWVGRNGRFTSSKGLMHPGYAGDPYIQVAAAAAPRIFESRVKEIISEASARRT